jgi:hypothetical protein
MMPEIVLGGEFYLLLYEIDKQLAAKVKAEGCACGGRLHVANYPRKPRGLPPEVEDLYATRFSLCCDREGCRRRHTPESVRFLGRRVYVGAVVVFASALRCLLTQATNPSVKQPETPRRTVRRWRDFWQSAFIASEFWQRQRANFMPPLDEQCLPASAMERFSGDFFQRLKATLSWLAPISTQSRLMKVR